MLGLGPHAGFIVAAYAVALIGFAALTLATLGDDRMQRRRLAELERQGIKRRSAQKTPAAKTPPAGKTAARKPTPKRRRTKTTPS